MMRFSSATVKVGKSHEFFHNDRTHETKHSIFNQSDNEYSLSGEKAMEIYKEDINTMKDLWVDIKKRKMPSNTDTLMSMVVNLNETHTLDNVKKVADYLKESLKTRIYQIAVHRDEGYIDKTGKAHINHHAHILMSGISYDEENNIIQSVKRNFLTKAYLRDLQNKVAKILNMPRSPVKNGKRLDTNEYKAFAQKNSHIIEVNNKLKEENYYLKKEVSFYMQESLKKSKEVNKLNEKINLQKEKLQRLQKKINELESRYNKLYQKAVRIIKKLRLKLKAIRQKKDIENKKAMQVKKQF